MSFTGERPTQKKWLPGYIVLSAIWGRYHKIVMVKVLEKLCKWIELPSHFWSIYLLGFMQYFICWVTIGKPSSEKKDLKKQFQNLNLWYDYPLRELPFLSQQAGGLFNLWQVF